MSTLTETPLNASVAASKPIYEPDVRPDVLPDDYPVDAILLHPRSVVWWKPWKFLDSVADSAGNKIDGAARFTGVAVHLTSGRTVRLFHSPAWFADVVKCDALGEPMQDEPADCRTYPFVRVWAYSPDVAFTRGQT